MKNKITQIDALLNEAKTRSASITQSLTVARTAARDLPMLESLAANARRTVDRLRKRRERLLSS